MNIVLFIIDLFRRKHKTPSIMDRKRVIVVINICSHAAGTQSWFRGDIYNGETSCLRSFRKSDEDKVVEYYREIFTTHKNIYLIAEDIDFYNLLYDNIKEHNITGTMFNSDTIRDPSKANGIFDGVTEVSLTFNSTTVVKQMTKFIEKIPADVKNIVLDCVYGVIIDWRKFFVIFENMNLGVEKITFYFSEELRIGAVRKEISEFTPSIKRVIISCICINKSFYNDLCAFIENIPVSVAYFDINILFNSSYDDLYDFFARVNFPPTITDLDINIENHNKDEPFSIYKVGDLSTIKRVVLNVNHIRYI